MKQQQSLNRTLSQAGFTLIEAMTVLTILAIVGALAIPLLRSPPDRLRLESSARRLASALRLSHSAALAGNREVLFSIDAQQRSFTSSAAKSESFDRDIEVAMTIAAPERRDERTGAIRFFPDGTATGGDIRLKLGGRQATVSVDWLTSNTHLDLAGE